MKPLSFYRGINLVNETFVYGYLTIDPVTLTKVIQSFDTESEEISTYNVDQRRIDICIGEDSEGQNIFLNDIVEIEYPDEVTDTYRVVYNKNTMTFMGEGIGLNHFGMIEMQDLIPGRCGRIKVIGNIYNVK